jgi:hypothetical protein
MTMPTREEIMECLQEGSSSKQWILLRRVADALDGCVVVPKEPTDAMVEAIAKVKVDRLKAFARDGIESKGVVFAVREEYAAMLAAANKEKAGNTSELETTARKLYVAWTDAQGIHCNRFPAWHELSEASREKWRVMAAANKENGND